MPGSPENFSDIARSIQLALAPAFLLTGMAALINVMAGRLARIVDRVRALTEGRSGVTLPGHDALVFELQILERRRYYTNVAITASVIAALLTCTVIAALALEVMFEAPLKWLIGSLFTAAMAAMIVGLSYFLREVHLAMRSSRIGTPENK
ncbi:MAG TPA: DUF2721 domain-containing protein [Candidatus Binatia bacterium]|nr:DUF2721 domain-containing protein [Candidatus Binatia bacterium]